MTQATQTRAITMAILAMGGEGGGVLADWMVSLGEHSGYWAQTTSVPGVAQRTGATIYYVELFPRTADGAEPILSTMPTPGEVDIVLASELMEAGRSVVRGLVTPKNTTLIASTHRVYSMMEKTALGDGRVDSDTIIENCMKAAAKFVGGDFAKIAEESGSVISSVLFGALAGTGRLPFTRKEFESAIERAGVGVATSLNAFARGFEYAQNALKPASTGVPIQIGMKPVSVEDTKAATDAAIAADPTAAVGARLSAQAAHIQNTYPASVRATLVHGIKRTTEYQDVKYADEFLARVASVYALDLAHGDGSFRLTNEAARYTALWMTYEDTIRVAAIKVRARRFDRIHKEARAKNEQVVGIMEFLHPQVQEVADTLPTALGKWVLRSKPVNALITRVSGNGIKVNTTSAFGYTTLYILSRLRPIRRRSLRFNEEQLLIDAWLTTVMDLASKNYGLACEVAETQSLVKGYGETHANGLANFDAIMAELPRTLLAADPVARQIALRTAALAEESGEKLRALLR